MLKAALYLLILICSSTAGAETDPTAIRDPYRKCVIKEASRLAEGPDAADLIARMAGNLCRTFFAGIEGSAFNLAFIERLQATSIEAATISILESRAKIKK